MRRRCSSSLPTCVLYLVFACLLFLICPQIDPSKGYKGITCFVATKDMGVQIAKKEQKLGIRASSTCALNFDDLKVPAGNVIGGEGLGYKVGPTPLNLND
jgi:short/branched chain acyl-CoA dehydrogenase